MGWCAYILLSALFLSLYDMARKAGLRGNSSSHVLFFSTLSGAIFFTGTLLCSGKFTEVLQVEHSTLFLLSLKSLILFGSWGFGYWALRTLPLTIAAPIRASAPLWTLLGAIFWFGEIPNLLQSLGMLAIFAGYAVFSHAGKFEGIDFLRNKAVWAVFAGTLLGASSALFDKYLLRVASIPRDTVQFWYMLILSCAFGAWLLIKRLLKLPGDTFYWKWQIPTIGICLMIADWLYFAALGTEGTAVSVLSLLRRSSVVATFVAGVVFFRERNFRRKIPALLAILCGVVLLCLAKKG